jgi:hypothetical protein
VDEAQVEEDELNAAFLQVDERKKREEEEVLDSKAWEALDSVKDRT